MLFKCVLTVVLLFFSTAVFYIVDCLLGFQHQIQQLPQNNLQQNNVQTLQRDNMPRGKDSKPRGRMTAYAFFVQTCRQEHKKKHPEEKIVFREFSKKCALRWKVRFFEFTLCYTTMCLKVYKHYVFLKEKNNNVNTPP